MLSLAAAAALRRLSGSALRCAASAAVPEAAPPAPAPPPAPPPLEPLPPKPLPTPPAPADALGETPVGPAAPALDFTDTAVAFKSKTTGELWRTLAVFAACRQRWLVNNADALLFASSRVLGARAANALVHSTFYAQFVGGADAAGLEPTLRRLRSAGVGAVLDYAAEDDVAAPTGPRSRRGARASAVARTFEYEDEIMCDRRMGAFLKSVDAAASAGTGGGQGFAAIKLTALGPPRLLERTSRALLAIRDLFRRLDADGDGTLTADEFSAGFRRLFSEGDPGANARLFDALDADHDGAIDYVAFTKGMTVAEGAATAARCRAAGPFAAAALSAEELQLLDRMVARASALAAAAAERGVKLMIDAEHSYYQPAIDAVALELQREHNTAEARVYNTYQCYTTDVHDRLAVDLERSRRERYHFGAKIVRGAYMLLERRRAAELGVRSPIWDTAEQTHAAYDVAVASLLPWVRDAGAEVMVATHNQPSVERAVAGMAALGLPPSAPVAFGQLLGMADHLTFVLGAAEFGAYKYVPFGSVEEVLPYLIRRAQENSDVLGGVGREAGLVRRELRRRLLG